MCSGLRCSEKNPEVSNEGGATAKTAELPVSCAQHTGRILIQTSGTDGKFTLQRRAFWRPQYTRYQLPHRGNPNPEQNIGFWKLISSILSDVEIFAEFTREITSEIQATVAEISSENFVHGPLQDKRKRPSPENCFCDLAVLN